jgi:hypothetical protein
MIKYEYLTIKCDPGLLEEKLNENGKFGWDFSVLAIEQILVKQEIQLAFNQPQIKTLYVLIFKRIIEK